jgi:5-methylcytosine-specific restriction enzyme A
VVDGLCRWCKGRVSGRRRTFCSDACVHEWRLRSSTSYLREQVFARDRGICALCGIDTVRLRRSVLRLPFGRRMLEMKRLQITRGRKSWWEADHILPVVEGGDSNLENVRTLCVACHRQATAELRERRRRYTRDDEVVEGRGAAPPDADRG